MAILGTYGLPLAYRTNVTSAGTPAQSYTAPPPDPGWQVPVYRFAARLAARHHLRHILDVGCGSGLKALTYLAAPDRTITGIDDAVCIEHCRRMYPEARWLVENFDRDTAAAPGEAFDLIICADVIEHVLYPERLLGRIAEYAHPATHILISTPERLRLEEPRPLGPPVNPLHIREWTRQEFAALIRAHGYQVMSHRLLPYRDWTLRQRWQIIRRGHWRWLRACQVVHAHHHCLTATRRIPAALSPPAH